CWSATPPSSPRPPASACCRRWRPSSSRRRRRPGSRAVACAGPSACYSRPSPWSWSELPWRPCC
ncbi:MAG: hypothetical protein AVDCRST_MAG35-2453, partial [uncultured Quadrisphaera sp.]